MNQKKTFSSTITLLLTFLCLLFPLIIKLDAYAGGTRRRTYSRDVVDRLRKTHKFMKEVTQTLQNGDSEHWIFSDRRLGTRKYIRDKDARYTDVSILRRRAHSSDLTELQVDISDMGHNHLIKPDIFIEVKKSETPSFRVTADTNNGGGLVYKWDLRIGDWQGQSTRLTDSVEWGNNNFHVGITRPELKIQVQQEGPQLSQRRSLSFQVGRYPNQFLSNYQLPRNEQGFITNLQLTHKLPPTHKNYRAIGPPTAFTLEVWTSSGQVYTLNLEIPQVAVGGQAQMSRVGNVEIRPMTTAEHDLISVSRTDYRNSEIPIEGNGLIIQRVPFEFPDQNSGN